MIAAELKSVASLCTALGLAPKEQEFLQKHSFYRYRAAMIPKRRGGVRVLLVPEDRLKGMQRKLLPLLESLHKPRSVSHGFTKKRSAKTNADAHQNRPFLLNLDLKDFFGSISRRRVAGVLVRLGLSEDVEISFAHCASRAIASRREPRHPRS